MTLPDPASTLRTLHALEADPDDHGETAAALDRLCPLPDGEVWDA